VVNRESWLAALTHHPAEAEPIAGCPRFDPWGGRNAQLLRAARQGIEDLRQPRQEVVAAHRIRD